jgi:protein-disulfide isomerase
MNSSKKKMLGLIVWLALIGALVAAVFKLSGANDGGIVGIPPPQPPAQVIHPDSVKLAKAWSNVIAHASAPPRGAKNPAYTVVEFGDFQCPQCGLIRPGLESAFSQAPVNMYFVNRPFPNVHHFAIAAAQASYSAAAQGKFWPMYDSLYVHQKDLEPGFYEDYATEIGLNGKQVRQDVESDRYKNQVASASTFCDQIGVIETPTLALRNNSTGDVKTMVGRIEIEAFLKSPPWTRTAAAVPSTTQVSKEQ